jgi:tetratricopeptide (TPR) repeat protein
LRPIYLHIASIALCLFTVFSCSVKKNTKLSRSYQAMTTRYNVYFNGIENYKEQLKNMESNYEDNFTRLVHMHPVSAYGNPKETKPNGSFDRTIEKCQKAIKLHSIQKKPKRNQNKMHDPKYREYVKRGEFNPFIHNAWLLMGKAQFYKGDFLAASATFIYITRHFTWKPDLIAESRIWLARCYLEMGWMYEAEDVLQKINNDGLPSKLNNWFSTVNADFLIRNGEYKQAIPYLQTAIKAESKKAQKIRMNFLLAQLYALTNDNQAAYQTFGKVIKMSPPYRTELNARIKQTEVFPGGDIEKIVKTLNKMAKSPKNKDYLDQIYYALGNLYLSRQDTTNAIKNYILAAQKSTREGIEKAISQLTLGNIYFNQRKYTKAQPCYAEAIPLIDETYPDYAQLVKRSEVLDELAIHAQNVELQDSLQQLAALPEPERMKIIQQKIDDLIAAEKRAEEEAKKEAYLAEQQGNIPQFGNQGGAQQPTIPNMNLGNGSNAWYFYNPALVSAGKTEFQRKWGRRKLEDDWRRRDKASFSMDDLTGNDETADLENEEGETEITDDTAASDTTQLNEASNDPHKPEFYIQQLPLTPEDIATSNEIIADGLFNMGIILKNQLGDFDASLDAFNRLDNRFPQNDFRLEAYYNTYLIYMQLGDIAMADSYKNRIIKDFPESKYAIALADPNYLDNLRKMDSMQDSIYNKTYQAYLENRNGDVHELYQYMKKTYPLSKLMPKFMLVDALAYVNEKKIDEFKNGLKELLEKYPTEDVSPLATDMLKGIAQGKSVVSGTGKSNIWEVRLGNNMADDSTGMATDSIAPFTMDKESPHLLVLVYPTDSISSNLLLFDVAKYNFSNFLIKDFDLEIISFNEISMLVVKGFNNFDELTLYRRMIGSEKGLKFPDTVRPVMISESNFKLLLEGRSFDEYFHFLEQNQ